MRRDTPIDVGRARLASSGADGTLCSEGDMGGTTVLDAARAVAEVARTHADETERGRRLAQPVVAAFEASGLGGALGADGDRRDGR